MLDTTIYLSPEKTENSKITVLAAISIVQNNGESKRDRGIGMTFLGLARSGPSVFIATNPTIVEKFKITPALILRKVNLLLRSEENMITKTFDSTDDGFVASEKRIRNKQEKKCRRFVLVEFQGIKHLTDVAGLEKLTHHYVDGRGQLCGLQFGNYVNLMRRGRIYAN